MVKNDESWAAVKDAVTKVKKEEIIELAKSLLDVLAPVVIAEKTGLVIRDVEKLQQEKNVLND
ncbi:hypothetical protein [Niallia sp. FSL R7-0271]|uniref:hypothetical protein n=1 Tax=Niallia sp. FSL R7-0271 TaxID=2921678 RepID=UPI0030F8C6E3